MFLLLKLLNMFLIFLATHKRKRLEASQSLKVSLQPMPLKITEIQSLRAWAPLVQIF